jgi:predicted dehydrogenase
MNDYMANITPIVEYNYDVFAEMFSGEVNHFYDCVVNGIKCKAPAEDGVMLMKILDAIYESALTGHEVKID